MGAPRALARSCQVTVRLGVRFAARLTFRSSFNGTLCGNYFDSPSVMAIVDCHECKQRPIHFYFDTWPIIAESW